RWYGERGTQHRHPGRAARWPGRLCRNQLAITVYCLQSNRSALRHARVSLEAQQEGYMGTRIAEARAIPGKPFNYDCDHRQHQPTVDPVGARYCTVEQVRAQWPCYQGTCSTCGQTIRLWASVDHLIALGD